MRTLVLGTAGHIDHGKSALVEALTGSHPDRLKEEQARGITIELGFGHARIGDLSVAFVDVPGHERFVRTMLAGAGGLDAVLLIVAADESVMPQTREHLDICRLLGISRGVIVLTKSDLVDAETLALVELEVLDLVAGTPLEGSPVVATSARTGLGLDQLRTAIEAIGAIDERHRREGSGRVPIDRVFSVRGFGTVVTGTLVSGSLAIDDVLELLPGGRPARVRGLQVHGAVQSSVAAPRRVAVNIGGLSLDEVRRGMTLAAPATLLTTRRCDVSLSLLEGSPPLRHGARVRVHQGTTDVSARVAIAAVRDVDGAWRPVPPGVGDGVVPPGGTALVRLRLDDGLVVTRGDRFVLRLPSPARTVGGGTILDPEPVKGSVRRPAVCDRLVTLTHASNRDVAKLWVDDAGTRGLATSDVIRRVGVGAPSAAQIVDELSADGALVVCGALVVGTSALERAAADLRDRLARFHREHPGVAGVPREEARTAVAPLASPAAFAEVLRRAGVDDGEQLALRTHRPTTSAADAQLRQSVLQALSDAGLQPPDTTTLAAGIGATASELQRVLVALGKEGQIARLSEMWFHNAHLAALKTTVAALGTGQTFDVAAAKARFGVSRKFAIPLLEYLDRERVTRRVGDKRLIL